MKEGAFDFLEKPFGDQQIIEKIQEAIQQDACQRETLKDVESIHQRYALLTNKEKEIILPPPPD